MSETILSIKNLQVYFKAPSKSGWPWSKARQLKAVDGVSFTVNQGETLSVVGESGCGKSTLARAILGLTPIRGGEVCWQDQDLSKLNKKQWREYRKTLQIIFQDPLASLNPRMTVAQIIAEPLITFEPKLSKKEVRQRTQEAMEMVGLLPTYINRYPHEFSGGQCQRIGIARALILKPKLLVCDEPVSALDVSIQAQIINLLKSLQQSLNLTVIFISHDLSVVKHMSDRIMVMYLGHIAEIATCEELYTNPRHPYTKALLSSIPIPDPKTEKSKQVQVLSGDLPSPINPPSGCVFRTRCPIAIDQCALEIPLLRKINQHNKTACIRVEQ